MTEHSESKAEAKPAVEYDIRTLTSSEDDLERIWQMWQTIFPKWPIERERLGKLLTLLPGHHHIHDNGFCLCYLEGTHGKIAAVGVLPEHRGKGLGTTLLTKAHDELRSAAQANGGELEFLELGSTTPRFWAQMPAGFPQEVKDFFVHRGFRKSTEPGLRDLYKDIRSSIAPPEILERVSKTNIKFAPWSAELCEECLTKQKANFGWVRAYEALASFGQFHEVMVAFDPETNAQIGWTLMCSPAAITSNVIGFLSLMPSKENTGLVAAVGVDESARGKGVGLALVVKALENMRERGVEGVYVDIPRLCSIFKPPARFRTAAIALESPHVDATAKTPTHRGVFFPHSSLSGDAYAHTMTTGVRRRIDDHEFEIHEDLRTEETEVMEEEDDDDDGRDESDDEDRANTRANSVVQGTQSTVPDAAMEYAEDDDGESTELKEPEEESEEYDSSDDDQVDLPVASDMAKLESDFPGFWKRYRLIKRIGEGTFSTVYKAEDKQYDRYRNDWDLQAEASKWAAPPLERDSPHHSPRKRTRYVAIKKIYVTSSPARILNELELLHDLRRCPSICPLITAFRHTDQVIAILPYFRHADFRTYFRDMTIPDIRIYLRSLFTALKSTHEHDILHRDIKPTNFLYDPATQHGVLVDFGLAEKEGTESKPCLCHDTREVRKQRQAGSVWAQTASAHNQTGYPKNDTRPSRRANRAGTRGFRAPEVLFKCTEQSVAIDIWSAGVILLTILSKRFPFFNSADDVEAMIEIATIFGSKRMKAAGLLHGCVFETTIPTVGQLGFTLEKIIMWSTCRGDDKPLTDEEKLAVKFLERCMELDPSRRITAEQALEHEFLRIQAPEAKMMDDEMDMLDA